MRRILTYILVLCAIAAQGQEYIIDLKHWDMRDGLSHRQVNSIYIDKQGFVWLATKNGLNRFDGYNFKVYNSENTHLPFNHLESVTQDATGDLWLQGEAHNEENVSVFNPVTNKVSTLYEKTGWREKVHVDFIACMKDSTVYFGRSVAPFFYTWHPVRGFRKVNYPIAGWLLMTFRSQNSLLRKSHNRELVKIDMNGKVIKQVKVPFITDIIHSDINGTGLHVLDSITLHMFYVTSDLEYTDVQSRLPAFDNTMHDNLFHVGVDSILWRQGRLYGSRGQLLRDFIGEGISELRNRLRDKKADSSGRIWMANDFGLYLLSISKNKFTRYFYQDPKNYSLNSYRGMLVDGGNLYACNEFSGIKIAHLKPGAEKAQFIPPAPSIGYFSVDKREDGQLAGLSSEFMFSLKPGSDEWTFFRLPTGERRKYFWKIRPMGGDTLLVGTNFGLAWLTMGNLKFSEFRQINQYHELANALVIDIAPRKEGGYWLCSNTGLYEYDRARGVVNRYSSSDSGNHFLPAKEFQHCLEDSGIYWLSTTKGLIRWEKNTGSYKLFTRQDGLSNENIYATYNDGQGRLWMSSDYGIMCYNKKTHKIKTYLTSSGITHNEFNRTSHFQDSNGTIYFGSLNGVTAFNPKDFVHVELEPGATIALTSYQQFDGKTNRLEDKTPLLLSGNRIIMNPEDLFFTISFSLLNYEDVEQNTYYWKIEGTDTGWTSMRDHVLRLSRLPYGEKVLRIKAQSGDGVWSENELRYNLIVIKPVYLRPWFIVLCTIIVATLLATLYLVRVKRLQHENTKLDRIVQEKTAGLEHTIRDLKESFEQKDILMKEIHHRVKNNLQVITVLLKLQLANASEEAQKAIEESMTRINSIALIHQYLYKNADLTAINLSTYASELCQQIEAVYRKHGEDLTLVNNIPPILLDIDTAIPLGIILNELMVNSNKYAFNSRTDGTIFVGLEKYVSHYTLVYGDDGPGLPDNYSVGKANSLGMTIVKSLATQLKGEVVYKSEENRFYITFKDTAMRKNIA